MEQNPEHQLDWLQFDVTFPCQYLSNPVTNAAWRPGVAFMA